jgi:hypothetical protein
VYFGTGVSEAAHPQHSINSEFLYDTVNDSSGTWGVGFQAAGDRAVEAQQLAEDHINYRPIGVGNTIVNIKIGFTARRNLFSRR